MKRPSTSKTSGRPSIGAKPRAKKPFGKGPQTNTDRPKQYKSASSTDNRTKTGKFAGRPKVERKGQSSDGFTSAVKRSYKKVSDGSESSTPFKRANKSSSHRPDSTTPKRSYSRSEKTEKTFGSDRNRKSFSNEKPFYKKDGEKNETKPRFKSAGYKKDDGEKSPLRKKKAYGSADTFMERKASSPSEKPLTRGKETSYSKIDGPKKRFSKTEDLTTNGPGKGKFTKKSELKGFKPRFRKGEPETDFRFMNPGSRGKKVKTDEPVEFVSTSKSQMKERQTEQELKAGESIRVNRFISNAGVCSRREADELIGAGLVSINGTVVTELGTKVKSGDVVRFNGEKLTVEAKVYIVLNKPKDAITTSDDPEGRNTVMDIFHGKLQERIFPVGRLDRNTTGVLLLTNDGELANRLMHPKYEIKKVYKATLNKSLKPADLWTLSNGVELEDGPIRPDAIACPDPKNKEIVGVEIHSGKNRIIHRMFEHLGYTLDKLDRVLYAGIEKGQLKRGEWRELTDKELKALKKSLHLK
jgi:23S rRNA pseudouridine2605 synthase